MTLVDRYILGQLLGPFSFGLVLFSTLWMVNILMKMIDLFVIKGVALTTIAKIFMYSMPVVLTTAAPMAVLLAVLMTVGRLSSDAELTALQASGIGFGRIAVPLIGFGLAASLGTMAVHEWIVPKANYLREKTSLNEVVLVKPLPRIAKDVFFEAGQEFTMFVRHYAQQSDSMSDVTIYQFQPDSFPRITEASAGKLAQGRWEFTRGRTHDLSREGALADEIRFGSWLYPVDPRFTEPIPDRERLPREMSIGQLRAHIRELESRGAATKKEWVELYFKTAFPMASLFLTLMAAPLAIGRGRSGTSLGIGLSILIMFFYYILLGMGRTMGDAGHVHPAVATWAPNILLGGVGFWLLRRAAA
ncbi:MAG: LptF/LptG family permease [Candidatus Wallbacteria bacterium]|nr:LptF/LptG family permease [Candidatus Wallbacteria bacterium]